MWSAIYNAALIVLVLGSLPKWLWERVRHKKYRKSAAARLWPQLPQLTCTRLLWIHAVSLGETKVARIIYTCIKERCPDVEIAISTTTETGQEEAKRLFPEARIHFYLPLDFSWNVKYLFDRLQPSWVLLAESDFWFQLVRTAAQREIPVILVNGKISERSFKRFRKVMPFARALFSRFALLCVQNEEHRERFVRLGARPDSVHVTGNAKLGAEPNRLSDAKKKELLREWGLTDLGRVVVIGSTHEKEEILLLEALRPLMDKIPELRILLAPRHPERFAAVRALVESLRMPSVRVVDKMGVLNACYQIADVAIVGGSFVEGVGGHNVFEPVSFGVPVCFGPFMHAQKDLASLITAAGAGSQLSLRELPGTVEKLLEDAAHRQLAIGHCQRLREQVRGSGMRLAELLVRIIN